jgi:hypothetical protein
MLRSTLVAAALAACACAAPAAAAPPANDTVATATPMTVPFDDSVSIADAGTEPFDAGLLQFCGGEVVEHTVWYRYTATSEGIVRMDADTTDGFQPGVGVSDGVPTGEDSFKSCGNDDAYIETQPGHTYYFAAFSRSADATGTLSVHARFRPKQVFVTVDPAVTYHRDTGGVTVTGTLTCPDEPNLFGFLDVRMGANTGRETFGDAQDAACTGSPAPWTAEVLPVHGRLLGRIAIEADAFLCDDFACEDERVDKVVVVKPR